MSAPTREQFVQQVINTVKVKFPVAKVARGDEPFSLRINGQLASLENLYRSAVLQPEQMNAMVEQWMLEMVRASEGSPDHNAPLADVADRILPMVLREESVQTDYPSIICQPLIAGLSVAYAVDSDRSLWYIPKGTLTNWRISIDELHDRAIANLVERSQAIAAHAAQDTDGTINLILFQTMDGFDASRLLLPTLHERLREHLGSPFAAAVPNRDILLCFRNDEQTVGRLREQVANDYGQMPHPVTDRLLLVTADGLAPRD